jgi:dTDP-4-dehydrorhamnose 3,5-epimerase-like enzyme
MHPTLIKLPVHSSAQGVLVAIEGRREVPFDIQRVYFIYGVGEAEVRGAHGHRKTRQMAVCVHGRCTILLDDGLDREIVEMDSPDKGLLLEALVWHEMYNFSEDCVMMVLANELYDESDYIRNYAMFRSVVDSVHSSIS